MWLQEAFLGPEPCNRQLNWSPHWCARLSRRHLSLPLFSLLNLQIGPRRLGAPGLGCQVRLARAVLAGLAAAEGPSLGGLAGGGAVLEVLEQLGDRLGRQVLVVVVVDLDHGGVDAGAQALDLDKGEEAVGGGLALLDAELLLDGLDDDVGAAAAELAGSLQRQELANHRGG